MTKVRERECSCGHRWMAPVVLSEFTPNLSGEATARCPKCGGANGAYVVSHPVKDVTDDPASAVVTDARRDAVAPFADAPKPAKRPKRVRPPSRVKRWGDAVAKIQAAIDGARAVLDAELEEGVSELEELKEEFESWKDNLPENLQQSPLGEKLEAVCDLDLDFSDLTSALDDAESKLSEAEGIDLPLGFGRD